MSQCADDDWPPPATGKGETKHAAQNGVSTILDVARRVERQHEAWVIVAPSPGR